MSIEDAKLHFQRGNAAFKQHDYPTAASEFSLAITHAPQRGNAYLNRAQTYRRLGNVDAALADFGRGLQLCPDDAAAHFSAGEFLAALRRPQDALEPLRRGALLRPDWPHVHVRLALTLRMLRRPLEAIDALRIALDLTPDDPDTVVQLATSELMAGQFLSGWRHFEARKDFSSHHIRVGFEQPMWLGDDDIADKTLLVHAEQGLGDTLQFCRYVPLLEARGAKVLFAPQASLKALMRSLSPTVRIVDVHDADLKFDLHTRLLSLPLAFGTTLDTVPAGTPYLAAEPARAEAWRHKLGAHGFKIGVCWQGSQQGQNLGRSFVPQALAGIASISDVRLLGLQRGNDRQQPALAAAAGIEMAGDYLAAGEEDFLDVAAIIQNCDLVISADTSILHLAGALAWPVWTPLNPNSDWRWLTEGPSSPWYPTLRLFRTERFGDFTEAFCEMETALQSIIAGSSGT